MPNITKITKRQNALDEALANLDAQKNALLAGYDTLAADDEEGERAIDNALVEICEKINLVLRVRFETSFHQVKNEWFSNIVNRLGAGLHNITAKQAQFFAQYCDADENTWTTNERYCCCQGFFVTLNAKQLYISIKPLTNLPA